MTNELIIEAIKNAQGSWDGADWPHEKTDADGHIVTEENEQGDDISVYCEGDDDECKTCCDAASDAAHAILCGDEAIAAIRRGDMNEAVSQINRASDIESEYGDDPTWGPVLKMAEANLLDTATTNDERTNETIIKAIEAGLQSGGDETEWDAREFAEARELTSQAGCSWDFNGWKAALRNVQNGMLGGVQFRGTEPYTGLSGYRGL